MDNVHPIMALALAPFAPPPEKPRDIANRERDAYIQRCKDAGREHDPILADETYWRALCHAEGRQYYPGD